MITNVSLSGFIWTPFLWIFVVLIALLAVAYLCHFFDSSAENEIDIREKSKADENEIINDDTALFAKKYLNIWMDNDYKYVMLPLIFVFACMTILLTE